MAEFESKIHPQFKEIAAAIKKNDAYSLSVALDNFNGNINEDLIDGDTALHYACENYSQSCFEPLHEAVDINVIKLLFNVRATNLDGINKMLKSVDIAGKTPLHQAAIYGNAKVVKLLLDFGASTEITDYNGKIPWDLAKPNSNIRRILEENDED
ncbi:ankyrin repeat domain-containing protein 39 homolog [Impatiens glandulifera]|uniref:ankyrin repeat domain-containing protein 39 homolog n=1 Tax=Impatiens glandulifera TaxID=253017 RepID=UPI001FB131A7|nr:ankyrin repeat domain-containing protein 39 homolog [Impatiens glandulifera]